MRVANGIYYYPEVDDQLGLGVLMPTFDQIANAIAKRSHARIVPTGDYALNVLGLSTQVPMNCVYLTDGSPRKVEISGGRGIIFKKTAPKNLSFKNRLAMLVTSALKSLGRENVTAEQIAHIGQLLRKEDKPSENRPMQKALKQNNLLKISRLSSEFSSKRRERDSNPRYVAVCRFSRPV